MTPLEVGICLGLVWSAILTVWSLADLTTGDPSPWLLLVACVYDGFDLTPRGITLGAVWAFVDGCVSGWFLATLVSYFW
jgi:hypothetical protein